MPPTSPELLFCHVCGRGRNADQLVPGWPYSFVAALETGRTSRTALLEAIWLGRRDRGGTHTLRSHVWGGYRPGGHGGSAMSGGRRPVPWARPPCATSMPWMAQVSFKISSAR